MHSLALKKVCHGNIQIIYNNVVRLLFRIKLWYRGKIKIKNIMPKILQKHEQSIACIANSSAIQKYNLHTYGK